MEQPQRQIRKRVNVSKSVKGVFTYDFTVETIEPELEYTSDEILRNDDILAISDDLKIKLETRYPIIQEGN